MFLPSESRLCKCPHTNFCSDQHPKRRSTERNPRHSSAHRARAVFLTVSIPSLELCDRIQRIRRLRGQRWRRASASALPLPGSFAPRAVTRTSSSHSTLALGWRLSRSPYIPILIIAHHVLIRTASAIHLRVPSLPLFAPSLCDTGRFGPALYRHIYNSSPPSARHYNRNTRIALSNRAGKSVLLPLLQYVAVRGFQSGPTA